MEENKIRIGITQGDINGVGYEVILKTFADPLMFDLCTPIVYGSPKVAAYHRKSLDLRFFCINYIDKLSLFFQAQPYLAAFAEEILRMPGR